FENHPLRFITERELHAIGPQLGDAHAVDLRSLTGGARLSSGHLFQECNVALAGYRRSGENVLATLHLAGPPVRGQYRRRPACRVEQGPVYRLSVTRNPALD